VVAGDHQSSCAVRWDGALCVPGTNTECFAKCNGAMGWYPLSITKRQRGLQNMLGRGAEYHGGEGEGKGAPSTCTPSSRVTEVITGSSNRDTGVMDGCSAMDTNHWRAYPWDECV
jgi:hypothetical protein